MMQIALDFSSRVPVENYAYMRAAHIWASKRFFTGAIGEKDKQVAPLIYEAILSTLGHAAAYSFPPSLAGA